MNCRLIDAFTALSLLYTILEGYNEVDTILLNVGLQFTFPLWWITFRLGNELRYMFVCYYSLFLVCVVFFFFKCIVGT